jgi:hypothetical protein
MLRALVSHFGLEVQLVSKSPGYGLVDGSNNSNSALVGCAVLIITLPLPGYLVRLRTTAQKAKMKKVGYLSIRD